MDLHKSYVLSIGGTGLASLILGGYLSFVGIDASHQLRNPSPEVTQWTQTNGRVHSCENEIDQMKKRQISFLEFGALIEKDAEAVKAYKEFAGRYNALVAEYEQLKTSPEIQKELNNYEKYNINQATKISSCLILGAASFATGCTLLGMVASSFRKRKYAPQVAGA